MTPATARAARVSSQAPSVLVVDEDPVARRSYAESLRLKGWIAFTAGDGRGGIDKATNLMPDVIVLDLKLPQVDGWTVLKVIRESSWTAEIPIVVVTALAGVRDEAFRMGADAYLMKPCGPEVLWLQIRALMRSWAAIGTPCCLARCARHLSRCSS
jgi:two-component system, OmpR family, response regulator RpaA